MLDAEISKLVRASVEAQWLRRRGELLDRLAQTKGNLTKSGRLHSGAAIRSIQKVCADELAARARIVWERLETTHQRLGSPQSETLADDMKRELETYIDEQDQQLKQLATDQLAYMHNPHPVDLISGPKASIKEVLFAEIDLYVAGLPYVNDQHLVGAGTTINITGSVGSIQTGAGSMANVTQSINAADKEALWLALSEAKALLQEIDDATAPEKQDVLQVMSDAETELSKEAPNKTKLRGLLMGAAITIQTIPAMQPAYQAIKAAVLQIGFHLP
jgi:hypothetical protein